MPKDTEVKIWTSEKPLFTQNKAVLEEKIKIYNDPTQRLDEWHYYMHDHFKAVNLDIRPDRKFDKEFTDELLAYSKQQEASSIPTVNVIILGTEDAILETLNPPSPATDPEGPGQGLGVGNIVMKIINENRPLLGIGNLIVGPFPMNLAVPEDLGRVPLKDYDKTYRSWSEQWDTLVSSSHDPDDPSTWSTVYADPTVWFCEHEGDDLVLNNLMHDKDGVGLTAKAIHYLLLEALELADVLSLRTTASKAVFAILGFGQPCPTRVGESASRVHWRRSNDLQRFSALQDGKKPASPDPQDQQTPKKTKGALPKLKIKSTTSCDCDGRCRKDYGVPASPEKN